MERIKNFVDNIHNDQYDKEYLFPVIKAEELIYKEGRKTELLDGAWNFCVDPYDNCLREKWYLENRKDDSGRDIPINFAFDEWETITVPSVWNMQKPEYFYYEGPAVYTRTFHYENHGEDKVILYFGAVDYEAKVFLNKSFIGVHKGGSTPFSMDVTKYLEQNNRIVVIADNTRKKEHIPSSNTDWFNYGGIYRSVELIRLPKIFIKDYSIGLRLKTKDVISGSILLSEPVNGEARLRIKELGIDTQIGVKQGSGAFEIPVDLTLWSPELPKLYTTEIAYEGDLIQEEIGFRSIEVNQGNVLLNGESIYLNGICMHEEGFQNGKAVSEDEITEALYLAKEMNCNFIRLAHYPHTEKVAKIADKLGMILWEEIGVYWWIDFANQVTFEDAKNQLSELMFRDKNRASVMIWSVGNENPDTDARLSFMSRLAIFVKELDPSRLVSAACLVDMLNLKISDRLEEYLDIIGFNEYFGWYNQNFDNFYKILENSKPEKPIVISEFGGDGSALVYGTIHDMGTENYQDHIYERQIEVFGNTNYIKGTSPWILYDFRSPKRNDRYQKGYNIKGLVSADRTHKKLAFFRMQEFYSKRKLL